MGVTFALKVYGYSNFAVKDCGKLFTGPNLRVTFLILHEKTIFLNVE
jgi:hypothetical protein